jgi:4-amino-4-deoxy-L-arabinose transferase-like glycosyltransferase
MKLEKRFKLIIALIFIVALAIRWWYLPSNAITFAYDQARDAFVAGQILGGDLKILGPSVSGVPNFYHGVLYYYLISPAYLLGQGSPIAVAYWLSFLNALCVFVVFFLAKKMTGKLLPAFLAATLFAVSFEESQYATWLSNPTMGVWFVLLLYTGLYLWLKEKKTKYLALLGFSYGLAIQSNVSLAYHIIPIGLWLAYSHKDIKKKQLLALILPFIMAISSMILVEVRFGFKSIEGIKHLFTSQPIHGLKLRLGDYLLAYANHMGDIFAHNLFPFISAFGGLLGLGILGRYIYYIRERNAKCSLEIKLLITWVLSYLVAASVSGSNIPHIGAGIGAGFIILTAFFIWEIYKKNKVVATFLVLAVVSANVAKIISENGKGQTIFAIQADMSLANELKIIDYTYQKAEGKPFSINSLTSPLYINTTWSYLYNWYGKKTYGYLPSWTGKSQAGSLGDNLVREENVDTHFYIIEDTEGIPPIYLTYGIGEEDAYSELISETSLGKLRVQERSLTGKKQ